MHVIAKRSFLFLERPTPINPDQPVMPAGRRHQLTATPAPQEIPAWLENDAAFKNAVEVGEIQPLTMTARAVEEEKPSRRKTK
jgi:hypothetical protein